MTGEEFGINELEECVARAICRAHGNDPDEDHCGSKIWEAWEEGFIFYADYVGMARAAIKAQEDWLGKLPR